MKTLSIALTLIIAMFLSQQIMAQSEINLDTKGDKIVIELKKGDKEYQASYDTWKQMENDKKLRLFLKEEMEMDIFNVDNKLSKFHFKRKTNTKCKQKKGRNKGTTSLSIDLNL